MVVDYVETVVGKYLLHPVGTALIFPCVLHKVYLSLTRQAQHLGVAILCGCRASARNHIEYGCGEGGSEHSRIVITPGERWEMAVEQHIGDTGKRSTLSRIREYLRRRQHQDVVVGVARHCGHIRRLIRVAQVTAVVHAEVCQVLAHHSVVLGGKLAYNPQLVLLQACPCRIVRV